MVKSSLSGQFGMSKELGKVMCFFNFIFSDDVKVNSTTDGMNSF
jgi:hypothetical protein